MKMKDRTKEERLAIRIYSGELALFAIIFAVLGVLRITQVIGYNETRRIVFNYITLVAAGWGIADFIWAVASPRRRKRVCLLDKIIVLPLVAFMITFDLISLIAKPADNSFYIISVSSAILYASAALMFQAIYHYFKPLENLMEVAKEDEEQEKPEENKDEKAE